MFLLVFRAAGQRYGIDARRVVEVVPAVPLRTVPLAPHYLAGLLNYRGRVVPVVDFGMLLGGLPAEQRLDSRIVLAETTRGLTGLLAERVTELRRTDSAGVAAASNPASPLGPVVETDGELVQLVAPERVALPELGGQP